jgi:hypothetical protein
VEAEVNDTQYVGRYIFLPFFSPQALSSSPQSPH